MNVVLADGSVATVDKVTINQETVLLSFCHCQDKTVIFYPSARVITHTLTNNLFLALRLL